jgi:hypothetical protein
LAATASVRPVFWQLLKFGLSGILGVTISALLYYNLRTSLPYYGWGFWFVNVTNVYDVAYYVLTTIIGGTVHFALSKAWVFVKEK